jgi:hypothetical protein
LPRPHLGKHSADHPLHAKDVHVENTLKIVAGEVLLQPMCTGSCVVDEDLDDPERLVGCGDTRLNGGIIRHVDVDHLGAQIAERLRRVFVATTGITHRSGDTMPSLDEVSDDQIAKAAAGPCYENIHFGSPVCDPKVGRLGEPKLAIANLRQQSY